MKLNLFPGNCRKTPRSFAPESGIPLWRVSLAAACLAAATLVAQAAPLCSARSPAHTVALVELYTSEGCDSCPPADRWLSSLFGQGYNSDRVVPLSLHVDYWDYIGWKDPYAKREFSARQHKLAKMGRAKAIYTPQVLLQGRDFRRRGSGEFAHEVARINSRPARASLTLLIDGVARKSMNVQLAAELPDAAERKDAALYLAAYENKLASNVAAGENRGKRLEHDFVVRDWIGPINFNGAPRLFEKRSIPLLPQANPKHSGVAAFVQNRGTGEVLQSLMLPACTG